MKTCASVGCSNPAAKPRAGSKGYTINYSFCNTCANLKSNYGITKPEKDYIVEMQEGLCPLCRTALINSKQTSKGESNKSIGVVDHCHASGKVRGVLCSKCNRGLGLLQDSLEILKNAIKYLEEYND